MLAEMLPEWTRVSTEAVRGELRRRRIEEWTGPQISEAVFLVREGRRFTRRIRRSITDQLAYGMEARLLADTLEAAIPPIDEYLATYARIAKPLRRLAVRQPHRALYKAMRDLRDDSVELKAFFTGLIGQARAPMPPVEWAKVREAHAASESGPAENMGEWIERLRQGGE